MKNLIKAFLLLPWLLIPPAFAGYTDHGNGTVTDSVSGLMWDKCSWGQKWGVACSGVNTATKHTWSQALGAAVTANSQSHRGYNDWRLPNKNELESLVKIDAKDPAIDKEVFLNTPSGYFWSSTSDKSSAGYAWGVDFDNGYVYFVDGKAYDTYYVRLVRGGQSFDALAANTQTHTVTATAGAGGAISPETRSVKHGATTTFTVTPSIGYSIASVTGCGGILSGNTYTTGVITSACTVSASFSQSAPTSYTVTAMAGTGGTISPTSQSVNHGATATFIVIPDFGYRASVSGCGGTLNGNIYVTSTITGACTIIASFIENPEPEPITSSMLFNGDYDGDGRADLIWHNSNSGDTYGMLLYGSQIVDAGLFYREPKTAWRIVQSGDFYGNGRDALLWSNSENGLVYMMQMNGLAITRGEMVYQEPNQEWQIVAVGDLNDDGRDDIVWWNSRTGEVYGMFADGASITTQGMMYQEMNTAWRILAARDFTGNGKADLLWRNVHTGQVYLMQMDGLSIVGGNVIYHEPNLDWSIVAVGDLNGDKKADLIYWNSQSGLVWGMLMNGPVITMQGALHQEPDTNWRIVSSGDYNGDGKYDLLWRHQVDGRIYQMPMNGLAAMPGAFIYQEANPDWRIVANANGDATGIPTPSRALSGGQQFAPLGGKPLNPYAPFAGEPLNQNLLPK